MTTKETLQKALEFSVEAHKGQVRKGNGQPYIVHPLSVMHIIGEIKKSSNPYLIATGAVLHDTVEDCDVTLAQIAENFGYSVAAIVQELTLDKSEYETLGKKEAVLKNASKMSSYALAIKLADRLHNVRDMEDMTPEFQQDYKDQTVYLVKGLKKNRKLTGTHKKLIKLIKKELKKY